MPLPKYDRRQMTLDDIEKGITAEQKKDQIINDLERELKDAKEIKGLLFAILKKLD